MKKIILSVLVVLVLLISVLLSYVSFALPNVALEENVSIEITAERLERGKYLANHVTVCIDCHSERDWTHFSGPIKGDKIGSGGEIFNEQFGFPGSFISKNITPFKLKDWTDAEILRAVTSGVSKDGHALFPIMPYPMYGQMDREDVYSIIAYIKSLEPLDKPDVASKANFPMNFIINTIPSKAQFNTKPDSNDKLAYGKYLVSAAFCVECHTQKDKGQRVAGMEYAGGFEFPLPTGIARSANITPDLETGIGKWSEEQFISKFKYYSDSTYVNADVSVNKINTPMPWMMYTGMTKEDLSAVYTYLKSLPAIKNEVKKFTSL